MRLEEVLNAATARLERADLSYGHGTSNAADEAAFIVLEGLGLPIDDLASVLDRPVSEDERERIEALVERRAAGREPAAYLLGAAYIGPYRFRSDRRALVPRSFIGELLVAGMDEETPLPFADAAETGRILELGTGSGCLAILAALAYPDAHVDAVDISPEALTLAEENVADYGLGDRVSLLEGDLFAPVAGRRYDLILANPPYVTERSMAALPPEYRHEPPLGLAGGEGGLDIVRCIVASAGEFLAPGGGLICEVGAGQAAVAAAFPDVDLLWLDTEGSTGEVFWLDAAALSTHIAPGRAAAGAAGTGD